MLLAEYTTIFYFILKKKSRTNTNEQLYTRLFFTYKVVYMHLRHVSSGGIGLNALRLRTVSARNNILAVGV